MFFNVWKNTQLVKYLAFSNKENVKQFQATNTTKSSFITQHLVNSLNVVISIVWKELRQLKVLVAFLFSQA